MVILPIRTQSKTRGRILGRNCGMSFTLCYSQSPTVPPPLSKSGLNLGCNVNIVYTRNLKSENSQDYAQKL
jgi:hypothetical protein